MGSAGPAIIKVLFDLQKVANKREYSPYSLNGGVACLAPFIEVGAVLASCAGAKIEPCQKQTEVTGCYTR